jgi:hypothetical protein
MSTTGLARRGDEFAQVLAARGGTVGHDHFWERMYTRKSALKLTGGAFAAAIALPAVARAGGKIASAEPRPLPVGFSIPDVGEWHFQFPVEGADVSSIFDFNGFCGVTELRGTGTLTIDDNSQPAFFDVDNRFMTGEYIGLDGDHHNGTFGFI